MNLNTKITYTQELLGPDKKIKSVYFHYDKKNYEYEFDWLKKKYEHVFYKEYDSLIDFINKLDYNHKLYSIAKLEQRVSKAPFIYDYLNAENENVFECNSFTISMDYTIHNNSK